ncbi:MAG TPA: DUF3999 family protein [Thermoanaerobaculia bacterium]
MIAWRDDRTNGAALRALSVLFLLLFPVLLQAQNHARTVTPGAAGPNRLDVDVALLAGATNDLRDLRLLDAQRHEVGYLLVQPRESDSRWLGGRTLPVAATKFASGFEVDLGAARTVDRIRLDGIDAPFLKPLRLEGSGDRARWTLLADATIFDLPDDKLRRTEVEFTPGDYRYLRVTWNDRASARVPNTPNVSARVFDSAAPPSQLRAPLTFTKRASEPQRSRYRLELPGPHLPIEAIELQVANRNVFRRASVTEPRLREGDIVPMALGTAELRRAERFGAVAEEMFILVRAPEGRQLDLVIDDGNNPPLEIRAVVARFAPQPWIYFESDGSPLTAQYGDARAQRPVYDVEALRKFAERDNVALAKWSGGAAVVPARTTQSVNLPLGSQVDRAAFSVVRTIPEAPAGLAIIPLDADVLARSRDLGDLRIVDAENRQVPYVIEKRDEPLTVALPIPQRKAEGSQSSYHFVLPYGTLPSSAQLVLRTSANVFTRTVTLRNDERTITSTRWEAGDPELTPPPLRFDASVGHTKIVDVVIDEGDNAPLPLTSAQLLLPSYAVRFHHPGGPLFLLYGNAQLRAPRYDLTLLAPRLFGEPARELTPSAVQAPVPEGDQPERKFFWIVIGVAALALLVLLARVLAPLLREEPRPLG